MFKIITLNNLRDLLRNTAIRIAYTHELSSLKFGRSRDLLILNWCSFVYMIACRFVRVSALDRASTVPHGLVRSVDLS